MPRLRQFCNFGAVAVICVLALIAEYSGLFSQWNRNLGDARMAVSPKDSDGQFVFVAVDARSLSDVGAWPWSRSVHATILDSLVNDGAANILLDFDFAFPADAEGDRAFKDALDRAGGSTFLAAFAQEADASSGTSLHYNLPMPGFAERSWPALVNVGTDLEGLVRHYPFGAHLGDTFVSSAGALMAGQLDGDTPYFEINFSIRPNTIRVVSAIDVLNGDFPEGAFSGRSVIVGASAIELSDQLAVPVHGVVPGPLIHVMAAETLMRDFAPRQLRPEVVAVMLLGLLAWLHTSVRRSPWLVLGANRGA